MSNLRKMIIIDEILEKLWAIRNEDKFYFIAYGKEWILELSNAKELDQLLCDISVVFDGWHNDGTAWSEWDESIRQRITEFRKKYTYNELSDALNKVLNTESDTEKCIKSMSDIKPENLNKPMDI